MVERLAIFGTSGFARKVADMAKVDGVDEFVFLRRDDEPGPKVLDGWPVRPESDIPNLKDEGCSFVIGVGDGGIRKAIAVSHPKLSFANIIHPAASFGTDREAVLNGVEGVIIEAGARICPHVKIGSFCLINLNATVGHDSVIADFVSIGPGANVLGNVHLEQEVTVGAGAVIMPGRTRPLLVGEKATIGATAWVTWDVKAGETMISQRARKLEIKTN